MNMKRFLMIGLILVSFLSVWAVAIPCVAQEKFPSKPITYFHGYPAGGTGDIPHRHLAESVSKRLGQPVVIVIKLGGGGSVALGEVARAKPDGYTIGFLSGGPIIGSHLTKLPFDVTKDFQPIIQHCTYIHGCIVRADSPFKTLKELIDYARANPGKVTYGTPGAGTPQNLTMIWLGDLAKVEWIHVPQKGGVPAVTAVLGGHVTCSEVSTEFKPFLEAGRVRLLSLATPKRMEEFADTPTLKELGYDILGFAIHSIVGPKGIPMDRVKILHDAYYESMQEPGYRELLRKMSMPYEYRNSEDLQKHIEELYEKSGEVLKKIGKK
jgi:tripartite-type tricarboxylate transporter receptor subunit TctC